MMNSMKVILEKFPVSPYGSLISIGLIIWILSSLNRIGVFKRHGIRPVSYSGMLSLFACSVPIGFSLSRLFWCIANYESYLMHPENILRVWEGGLSLWGFILGFWFSVSIFSKRLGISAAFTLDAYASGMLLFITLLRMAEAFTGQGIGRIITYDFLINPFTAVYDSYGEAHFAVYRFEAMYAFILFIIVLYRTKRHLRFKKRTAGNLWRFAVGGYAMAQIAFESMRDDDYMRFGFVRVSQAIAILMLVIFSFCFIYRLKKKRLLKAHFIWMTLFTLASGGLVILQEFRVDAALHTEKEHLFMMIYAFFLFFPSLFAMNRLAKRKEKKTHSD